MKLKCVLISACLAIFVLSSPMFPSDIGVKAGLSLANLQLSQPLTVDFGDGIERPVDTKNLSSWQIGGFINFKMSARFSLQPEVYYVTRGMKIDEILLGSPFTGEIKFTYVEVPLLLKYHLPIKSYTKLVLYAGQYVAMNLKAEQVLEVLGQKVEEDIKDDIRDFDFGLVFGGGVESEIGSLKVIFDARFSFGLININEAPGATIKVKNKAIVFLAGIGF